MRGFSVYQLKPSGNMLRGLAPLPRFTVGISLCLGALTRMQMLLVGIILTPTPICKAVRGKLPNAWGLYDMSGNVWEWTWDWMDDYPAGPVTNPTGPEQGLFRIIRGGGVGSSASDLRSAYRLNFEPDRVTS